LRPAFLGARQDRMWAGSRNVSGPSEPLQQVAQRQCLSELPLHGVECAPDEQRAVALPERAVVVARPAVRIAAQPLVPGIHPRLVGVAEYRSRAHGGVHAPPGGTIAEQDPRAAVLYLHLALLPGPECI